MPSHGLSKKGHIIRRMNKYAKQLNQFTTSELSNLINSHRNKSGNITKMKVSNNRLASILYCSKNIRKVGHHNGSGNQIWAWCGEE
tara:strand:- start:302 stop:559 length:258 start_codon:yes stop_codon:yes gene_type:complete